MRKPPERKIHFGGSKKANALRRALQRAQTAIEMAKESGHTGIALARLLEGMMLKAENPHLQRFYERERDKILAELSAQRAKDLKTIRAWESSKPLPGKGNRESKHLNRFKFDSKVTNLLREGRYEEALEELRVAGDKDWMHGLLIPPNIFHDRPEIAAKWLLTTAGIFLHSWRTLKEKNPENALECKESAIDCLVNAGQMFTRIGTSEALETAERIRQRVVSLREGQDLVLGDSFREGDILEPLPEFEEIPKSSRPSERLSMIISGDRLISDGRFEEGLTALWQAKSHNDLYLALTTNEDLRSSLRPVRRALWFERTAELFDESVKRTDEISKPKEFRTNEKRAIECLGIALKILFKITPKTRENLNKISELSKKLTAIKRRS